MLLQTALLYSREKTFDQIDLIWSDSLICLNDQRPEQFNWKQFPTLVIMRSLVKTKQGGNKTRVTFNTLHMFINGGWFRSLCLLNTQATDQVWVTEGGKKHYKNG